jgi:hypothetical protein
VCPNVRSNSAMSSWQAGAKAGVQTTLISAMAYSISFTSGISSARSLLDG